MSDNETLSKVYILSAVRSPIGSLLGQYTGFPIIEVAKHVLGQAVSLSGIAANDVDEVYVGNVLSAGHGQNPARQAALAAGIPISAPATTLNMLCGSGLKAVAIGFNDIRLGDSKVVLSAGMEHMSEAEHTIYMRSPHKLGPMTFKDSILHDGLTCAISKLHMGETAENLADMYKIERATQDMYAVASQNRATESIENALFDKEIVKMIHPITGAVIEKDEHPRAGVTVEKLAKMKPAFRKAGTVTAGNASGINDGVAALILADERTMIRAGNKPLARIIGYAESGNEPELMGLSPVSAVHNLVKKIGWKLEDVDLFELNEAFAAQYIAVLKQLKIDEAKVNVTGGAIALGHPIGCSGARVLVTLIHNLRRLKKNRGIASLCVGGGIGVAMAVEALHSE